MTNKTSSLVLFFLMTSTLMAKQPTVTLPAQQPTVTSLISKDLKDIPGREALMIVVEYPPGGADPIHRHNAHAFVYVIEG